MCRSLLDRLLVFIQDPAAPGLVRADLSFGPGGVLLAVSAPGGATETGAGATVIECEGRMVWPCTHSGQHICHPNRSIYLLWVYKYMSPGAGMTDAHTHMIKTNTVRLSSFPP